VSLPPSARSDKLLPSFGRRRGRKFRAWKQQAWEALLPELQITPEEAAALRRPLWLEIGFGSGEHLAAQAAANSGVCILGCEPYVNGIGNLLMQLRESPLPNLRLFTDDARLLLDALPPGAVERVFILFPDPWPKARHHKRRLISPAFLAQLARAMAPGARLLLATDHVDYLSWMLMHLLASPDFAWTAQTHADWSEPPAGWVRTRYQEKAENEGRGATYLDFGRI